ncbi:MAG: hypothetical protein F9K32_16885 [Desulfobulbaceae bacterium]|nr:MAG: hypothetical protein F9K32_16885 [Desulfobulbaceae bacterium]
MAAREKKQGRRVSFELSWGGIAGLTLVIVCLCLWMFILGVWTGQSLLQSSFSPQQSVSKTGSELIAPLLGIDREQPGGDRQ